MEGGIVVVVDYAVVAEQETVNALGIKQGLVECLEDVVNNAYCVFAACKGASVEVFLLSVKLGYLGVDADDGIGELEGAGEGVEEAVLAYEDIAACACLVPSVAVAAQQYGCAAGVVEEVVLAYDLAGRGEEGAACTVVAYGVVGEIYGWCPGKVLDAIGTIGGDLGWKWAVEAYNHFFLSEQVVGAIPEVADAVYAERTAVELLHSAAADNGYLISGISPVEAP